MLPQFRNRINYRLGICLGTALGLAGMLTLAGCGGSPMNAAGSEDEAIEVLTAALDAWKSGQKPDELRQDSSPMYVKDVDWTDGRSLKAFQAPDVAKENGGEWRVTAMLTLAGAGKPDEQKLVAYSVTTASKAVVISRSDNLD